MMATVCGWMVQSGMLQRSELSVSPVRVASASLSMMRNCVPLEVLMLCTRTYTGSQNRFQRCKGQWHTHVQ